MMKVLKVVAPSLLLSAAGTLMAGQPAIEGVFPILMTPYCEDGSVDYETLAVEADFLVRCGAKGVIWPAALDALGHLDPAEERVGLEAVARALDGKSVWFAPCCPGTNTADAVRRVRVVESIAAQYPKLPVSMLVRMADDCRTDAQITRHFEAIALSAHHPVIIQTFAPNCPMPKMRTLIDLARRFPDLYGWFKVEGCDKQIADCIAELNAAKPTVKNVLNGWGGRDLFYHFRRFGSRGVITQRPAYADLIAKAYAALERAPESDEARELFLKILFLRNLDDVLPEKEMRGWHLYALCRRGVFKNLLSRTEKSNGKWQVTETVLTDIQKAEADCRLAACGLKCSIFPPGTMQRERLEKRLEICQRLPELIRSESELGDRTGRCLAEMGREDQIRLKRLFEDERIWWARYPLAPGIKPIILNVCDYGAKGDGLGDATHAFDAALAAVAKQEGKPCILEIPAGVYRFTTRGRRSQFRAEGLANCVIRGDSDGRVEFVFEDYDAVGVELSCCTNVTFAGIEVSLRETPFVQGTVVNFDKTSGAVDIITSPDTLLPTDARLKSRPNQLPCALFDGRGRRVLGMEAFFDRRSERLADGKYRIYLNRRHVAYPQLQLEDGWQIVICDRDNDASMIRARGSYLCNFERVTVRNSRAAAFALSGSYYPSLWHVRVLPKSDRHLISSNADGAFLPRGAFVAHSEFDRTNDDGCNCLAYGRMIRDLENGKVVVAEGLKGNYAEGDLMLIVSSATGEFLYAGRVGDARKVENTKWHRTTFVDPIPADVTTLKSLGRSDWTQKDKRDLVHGRIHIDKMADQLFRPYAWGVSLVLSDCTFRSLRGTGAVVQCADALIENCRFESMNTGVSITSLLEWNEGPAPYNVIVRNCGFSDHLVGIASVYRSLSGKLLPQSPMRHVELTSNVFSRCRLNYRCTEPVVGK